MDFYGQVVAVECKLCGEVGHDIESSRLRDRFPKFCRKHARTSKSYSLEPTITFRDSYIPEPNYKPHNNSHNHDRTPHQDSSWTYNEDNSLEQPRSYEDNQKSYLAIVEQQGNLEDERNKMIEMNEELIALIKETYTKQAKATTESLSLKWPGYDGDDQLLAADGVGWLLATDGRDRGRDTVCKSRGLKEPMEDVLRLN
ncbi:hypothetical protein LWI28_015612 [Acer negundo]|uniref:Uncharacterized protein n=1 Tax=Acer negundo TaxID=4023 RepID=A0AAD5IZJ3_ACENE|nr:hypothetical protein LWI28_015612 [Acer negundo]